MCGFTALRTAASSCHERLVDLEPAGGVDDDDVAALRLRLLDPVARDRDRVLRRAVEVDGDLDLLAELLELVDRGRPLEVGGDERRRLALLLAEEQRELGRGGRLPRALEAGEQDRPSAGVRRTRACEPPEPISSVSSSCTMRTTSWPGVRLFVTAAPTARSRTRATNSLTTLKLTSASSSARRISRIGAREVLLGEDAAAAEVAERALELVGKRVEHGRREV